LQDDNEDSSSEDDEDGSSEDDDDGSSEDDDDGSLEDDDGASSENDDDASSENDDDASSENDDDVSSENDDASSEDDDDASSEDDDASSENDEEDDDDEDMQDDNDSAMTTAVIKIPIDSNECGEDDIDWMMTMIDSQTYEYMTHRCDPWVADDPVTRCDVIGRDNIPARMACSRTCCDVNNINDNVVETTTFEEFVETPFKDDGDTLFNFDMSGWW